MGAFRAAADLIISLSDSEWITLLVRDGAAAPRGMVLDGVSIFLITIPLLVPVMQAFGWSQVWFGVVMAINIAIGQVTPPVAVNLMCHRQGRRRADGGHLPLGFRARAVEWWWRWRW